MFMKSPLNKLESSPSLGALLSDSSLFEEIPLEVHDEGAFTSLGDLFGRDAMKEARDPIKDATPFKVTIAISTASCLVCVSYYFLGY